MFFGFSTPVVPQITAEEVKDALDTNTKSILLDVRTAEEFARYRIKGAINLPVDLVTERIENLIPDKNSKVIVYCLSASRSVIAVDIMKKFGYTNVFNMTSGLLAWSRKQFPLEN